MMAKRSTGEWVEMATVMKPPADPAADPAPAAAPAHKANILLVDDRRENLVALEAVLNPLKQNLILAGSGEEALKCLLKKDVAVILLDVKMPGFDGFETAAYIKQLERTRHIPIIFLTAISKDQMHIFRGYSVGAVDYVVKPFDPAVLRSKVAAFVELYEKTLALHESEERFKRAFSNAPIGVALVTLDGRFLMVNRALCEMTGYQDSQLLTMDLQGLGHTDSSGWDLDQMAKELAEEKRSYRGEAVLKSATDEDIEVLMSASFVPGVRDTAPYFIFQMTDITERKRLETFRDRFVASAAHELRTPTSVIIGTIGLLSGGLKELTEEEVTSCLEALERQGTRLSKMVASLLDLARLEEGRLDLKIVPVSLLTISDLAVQATTPPLGKSVALKIEPDLLAMADPDVLDRIITNLLVNAYHYGGQNITVEATQDGTDAYLSIMDDGEGVPPDLVGRLFDPFARGGKASRVGGSGLGLSLVRSLARSLGGDVQYAPEKPRGARFTISLRVGDGSS